MADQAFSKGVFEIEALDDEDEDLKIAKTELSIPYNHSSSETFGMNYYIGPNDFDLLRTFDQSHHNSHERKKGIINT